MAKKIVLDGSSLTLGQIKQIIEDSSVAVEVSAEARRKVKETRDFLEQQQEEKIIYGVNTGFGPMASHIINNGKLINLQDNLIKSHAVGIGEPIADDYVLASMVVRLNTLVKGYSGVSTDLIDQLVFFINNRIMPVIPEHGAVGTSGDLVQLAHIAAALIGEGQVSYQGKRQKVSAVLKKLSATPYKLKTKEGLSLINGTSVMSGIATLVCIEAENLVATAIKNGAFAVEIVNGFNDSTSKKLHDLRPHKGQVKVAKMLRDLLASSQMQRHRRFLLKEDRDEDVSRVSETIQEVYSFRCIAQILGPVVDTLEDVSRTVEIEMNSVTDNPVVDKASKSFIHGGNFHGDYIASRIDHLKASLVRLTMLSERRINFFMNANLNRFFPPFLNLKEPGLTLGLQGLQFVATSTTAQSQSLAFPHHIHSIPTNADNQDVVSMGTDASLMAVKVVDNAYTVLAIELITLSQAMAFLGEEDKLSDSARSWLRTFRPLFPPVYEDRVLIEDLSKAVEFIKTDHSS